MYPHVVLEVGGAGEAPPAALLLAHVGPLPGVGADVHLADVGGGEGAATALERTLERPLAWDTKQRNNKQLPSVLLMRSSQHAPRS